MPDLGRAWRCSGGLCGRCGGLPESAESPRRVRERAQNDGKRCEALIAETSSGARVFGCWPRSANPPDLAWHARGQGFKSPHLHRDSYRFRFDSPPARRRTLLTVPNEPLITSRLVTARRGGASKAGIDCRGEGSNPLTSTDPIPGPTSAALPPNRRRSVLLRHMGPQPHGGRFGVSLRPLRINTGSASVLRLLGGEPRYLHRVKALLPRGS